MPATCRLLGLCDTTNAARPNSPKRWRRVSLGDFSDAEDVNAYETLTKALHLATLTSAKNDTGLRWQRSASCDIPSGDMNGLPFQCIVNVFHTGILKLHGFSFYFPGARSLSVLFNQILQNHTGILD